MSYQPKNKAEGIDPVEDFLRWLARSIVTRIRVEREIDRSAKGKGEAPEIKQPESDCKSAED